MNVRIQYPVNFNCGVWYKDSLRMNNTYVKLHLRTNTLDSESQTIAFDRIKHFLYGEMDNTIFINSADEEAAFNLASCGLNLTTLPGEPVDQLIGLMLYYKLNAIMEDRIIVTDVEISSSLGDSITYIHSENEVPDITGEDWWDSADLVHCDIDLIDTDQVVTLHQVGAWRELDLGWPSEESDNTDNTVKFDFNKNDN